MISAGVIGWPVAHSKSPLIHRFWLAKLGIDGDYGRFPVAPDRLGAAVRALSALGLRGVNVTVPHKVAVMEFLDRVDPLAARVGAVNTVVVTDEGELVGHNTDVAGFEEPLYARMAGWPSARSNVLYTLIGTGGAARAVAVALAGQEVTVHGRDAAKTRAFATEFALGADYGHTRTVDELATAFAFRDDPAHASALDHNGPGRRYSRVIINATTLGMTGQPALAIDLSGFPDDTIVYDLVYAPVETPLLRAARKRGMWTIDGLAMLIGQASVAFALFYGATAPREFDTELRALLTA